MASGVISDRECVSSRFNHIGFPASQSIRNNSELLNLYSNSPLNNNIASVVFTTIDLGVPLKRLQTVYKGAEEGLG